MKMYGVKYNGGLLSDNLVLSKSKLLAVVEGYHREHIQDDWYESVGIAQLSDNEDEITVSGVNSKYGQAYNRRFEIVVFTVE